MGPQYWHASSVRLYVFVPYLVTPEAAIVELRKALDAAGLETKIRKTGGQQEILVQVGRRVRRTAHGRVLFLRACQGMPKAGPDTLRDDFFEIIDRTLSILEVQAVTAHSPNLVGVQMSLPLF